MKRKLKDNDEVSVCLTGLLKDFEFCHMDGVIESHDPHNVTVRLDQLGGQTVRVAKDDLRPPVRGANKGTVWKKGDKVHVLQTIEGVDGWWEATVIKKEARKWRIKWTGEYEDYSDEDIVSGTKMRRADADGF